MLLTPERLAQIKIHAEILLTDATCVLELLAALAVEKRYTGILQRILREGEEDRDRRDYACRLLVEHLHDEGATQAIIPVQVDGQEYQITVERV